LQEEIEELKKSVPALFSETPGNGGATANISPTPDTSEGSGLISHASTIFSRSEDIHEIEQLIDGADTVGKMARQVQAPMRTRLRATIEQGRGLANQTVPPDSAGEEESRERLRSITAQFKRISSATIPLIQELILLDESQASLRQWEDSAHRVTSKA